MSRRWKSNEWELGAFVVWTPLTVFGDRSLFSKNAVRP
jgi:hypothetical protein